MAQGKTDNLEAFAKRIATRIRKADGNNTDSMERLICRLLTGDNPTVASKLASEWVEWRYGKPKQPVVGDPNQPIKVEHTIRFGNAKG